MNDQNELWHLITEVLKERKLRNHAYSLRALARDLKIDVGQLQRICTNRMEPSPLVAYRVGIHLNLGDSEILRLIGTTVE